MKKKILIVLSVMLLIGLILGMMYLIDRNRMKNNKPVIFSTWGYSYAPPVNAIEEDQIILNSDYVMSIICYDAKSEEINKELEELKNLIYPAGMNLSRALNVYVKSDINADDYDELHDIFLLFEGGDKNFTITMALEEEPLTDYKNHENQNNYIHSLISGNPVAILHSDKKDAANQKTYYTCIFEFDDVHFVVETTNLTQDEVVSLIKSIFNCNMKNVIEQEREKTGVSFYATIIESNEKSILVEPKEGSNELKSSDRISIGLGENNDTIFPVGATVKITYDGMIMETYPAKIIPTNIEIVSEE